MRWANEDELPLAGWYGSFLRNRIGAIDQELPADTTPGSAELAVGLPSLDPFLPCLGSGAS